MATNTPCPFAYRVECYRIGPMMVFGLGKWHRTLADALEAMLEHQQRRWASVALIPQPPRDEKGTTDA